jgi:hypothetical protein
MRQTALLLAGALLWAVVGAGVYRYLEHCDVPLRVGMRAGEVRDILGGPGDYWPEGDGEHDWAALYLGEPDVFENYLEVTVHFDGNNRVVRWEKETQTVSFRDWWTRSLRSIGL